MSLDKLLTIADAAALLEISSKHFRQQFVNPGLIDVISLGRGTKGDRISPDDLKTLIKSRRQTRCLSSAGKSGMSDLRRAGRSFNDPLGHPAKDRLKNLSAV
jgi:hypothetical protein